MYKFKDNKITASLYIFVLICSFFSTIYVYGNTPCQLGAELYFTLPLTLLFCLIVFRHIIPYHKGGYGLKVFYFFCALRYVFLPFFTCIVGSFASSWTAEAYTFAIIIQDIELIVSCFAISYFYPRQDKKITQKLQYNTITYYEDLSLGGIIVILLSIGLIATRGLNRLLVSMRFGIIAEGLEEEAYYGYDIWMAHTMLAFLAIVITSSFQKLNDRKEYSLNILVPAAICLLTCFTTFGNNRMMTVYYALSAISILSISFPKYKRSVSIVVMVAFSIVIFSFTMVKQYQTNITIGETADTDRRGIVSSMAVYVSSTEAIAKVYDRYKITGNQMETKTILADIADKTTIFELPMIHVKEHLKDVKPSYKLAMTGVEVVPVAGQMLYYGGYELGWLLDILAFWIVMLLLVKFEIHSKLQKNLGNRYLFTWMSIVSAMVMCYHLGIMYHAFTYVPFFTWVALLINKKIRIHPKTAIAKVRI